MLAQDIMWHHINPGFDTPTNRKKQKHPAIVSSCHVKEMLEKKNSVQLDEPTKK